jgi:hypothetical protein
MYHGNHSDKFLGDNCVIDPLDDAFVIKHTAQTEGDKGANKVAMTVCFLVTVNAKVALCNLAISKQILKPNPKPST